MEPICTVSRKMGRSKNTVSLLWYFSLPKPCNLNLITGKHETNPNWRIFYKMPDLLIFKRVKVRKIKGRVKNHSRLKETKQTGQPMAGRGSELDPIAMKGPGATGAIYTGFEEQMIGSSHVHFSVWVIILYYAAECLWRHSVRRSPR